MRWLWLMLVSVALLPQVGNGQGTFQNLGFELANPGPPRDEYSRVDIATALPGWSGYCGTVSQPYVGINGLFLDSAGIWLLTKDYDHGAPNFARGNYYVLLQGGVLLHSYPPVGEVATAIAQTAQIPPTVNSVILRLRYIEGFEASFAGHSLAIVPWLETADYTYYGVDLREFSGQTGELRFTANGWTFIDDLWLSPIVVPEPGTTKLLAAGLLMFPLARQWRSRRWQEV